MARIWADRVLDSTTTTGTGAKTVSGIAPRSYQTFSAVMSVNDTAIIAIVSRDTADWEVGEYTYTSSNVLTPLTVLASSNSGAAVNFGAGTKDVALVRGAAYGDREVLSAARTYYVRTDGSDSNNGLANTAAGAKLTFAGAYAAYQKLDTAGFTVTIQMQNTTWTAQCLVTGGPAVGGGPLLIDFAGGTLNVTGASCIAVSTNEPITVYVQNVTLTTTGAACLDCLVPASVLVSTGTVFGSSSNYHLRANAPGAIFYAADNYTITGGAVCHWQTFGSGSSIQIEFITITLTGTPNFSGAFVNAQDTGYVLATGLTFSGSATGTRYVAQTNGGIQTGGGGANYFPGNGAGTTATGGYYA